MSADIKRSKPVNQDENNEADTQSESIKTKHGCPFCPKTFSRADYVQGHVSSSHFGKEIICDCGSTFTHRMAFVRHLNSAVCPKVKANESCKCCSPTARGNQRICPNKSQQIFERIYKKFIDDCKCKVNNTSKSTPTHTPSVSSLVTDTSKYLTICYYINNNNIKRIIITY